MVLLWLASKIGPSLLRYGALAGVGAVGLSAAGIDPVDLVTTALACFTGDQLACADLATTLN